jgi:predicted nucleic acid-binding protein
VGGVTCLDVSIGNAVWKEAETGQTVIWTSFLTFAEVFRAKCEGAAKPLREEEDRQVEQLLNQTFIRTAVVDEPIALSARRLMRQHPECKKPSDGIHVATALALNVDEMHTYDGSDLLHLTGKILRADGVYFTVSRPTPIPPPPAPPSERTLFDQE